MEAVREVFHRAGLLVLLAAQPCIFATADIYGSASHFVPHPASIYSGQTYRLLLKKGPLSFTHWQLRAHGALLANGRVEDGAIELTVPGIVPGGGTSASLSLLDEERGVHQGVFTFRVYSLPYYPEGVVLPDEVVLLGELGVRSSTTALFGVEASADYPVATAKSGLDLAIILGRVPKADGLIKDIVSANPRLADDFLLVVSVRDAVALSGLLQEVPEAESVVQQQSYLWSDTVSAELACMGLSEEEVDDGWLPYFRRAGASEEYAELWGSVLLDFGGARILITRCNIDGSAALTPDIYDALVSAWAGYKGNGGEGNEK